MTTDPIFRTLPRDVLDQIAQYLKWDPVISSSPTRLLLQCDSNERQTWLDSHRSELEQHISWVGTPIFSYALGNAKSYSDIVADLAAQVGASVSLSMDTPEIETALVQKLWTDTLSRLSTEEREALLAKVEAVAAQYRTSTKKEIVGFASLAAAQMSGFGVYLLGSTLLGALNSALGLGLGFGAFTGLSSVISIVIGPVGWAALGLYTVKKLGAPNYKKLLPVAILIASQRAGGSRRATPILLSATSTAGTAVIIEPTHVQHKPQRVTPPERERQYSKAEKTLFNLRPENRALFQITEEFFPGTHYLDLPQMDQQVIRELKMEREQASAEEQRITDERAIAARKEARKQKRHEEAAARAAKKQDRKSRAGVARRTKDYARLLRNLEFDLEAIERLEHLGKVGAAAQVDEKLGLMNAGQVVYRDFVPGTNPSVYETKAGYDYRIYYFRSGPKIHIRLIGDKGTQDADMERLRRPGR
jgi:uncharacterized protein YaaW (UPF0174 family)